MTTTAATVPTLSIPTNRTLHIGLWVAQALLAAAFMMTGAHKLFAPIAQLQAQMPWVNGALGGAVRFIGVMEILGALGIVLPAATRIMPRLTSLAAGGLMTVMILATLTHVSRGEFPLIALTLTLGGLAAFTAWGRWKRAPIAPRA